MSDYLDKLIDDTIERLRAQRAQGPDLQARLDALEESLTEGKLRCDCRWAETVDQIAEIDGMLAPAALSEGAVVLRRMPLDYELGRGSEHFMAVLRSLVVPS